MRVFRGINWIADRMPFAPSESEATWVTTNTKRIWLASLLRREYPLSTPELARGSADISFAAENTFVIATHPRPYEQWIYDSLKSDIAVVASISERRAAEARLDREKASALLRKEQLASKLEQIAPTLSEMHSNGLIDAALGRGSYFDKNGYPSEHDDIDIILLKNRQLGDSSRHVNLKEEIKRTVSGAKGDFGANFVDFKERVIKKAASPKDPIFSFILITTDYIGLSLYYEKYVLSTCTGIEADGMPAAISVKLAHDMIKRINADEREKLVREGKLSVFPQPPKTQ